MDDQTGATPSVSVTHRIKTVSHLYDEVFTLMKKYSSIADKIDLMIIVLS